MRCQPANKKTSGARDVSHAVTEWANMDAYKKWWTEAGEKDIKMLHQYTNSFKLYAAEGIAK